MHAYSKMPVPVIAVDSDDYQELRKAVETLRTMLKPASDKEIIYELKKLSTHCGIPNRESINFAMMLDDYLDDLNGFPLDLIQYACRQYRNAPGRENDFFPRPGRLKPLMSGELSKRKFQLMRLEKLLETADNPSTLTLPPTQETIAEQARNQAEVEKMLSKFTRRKRYELSPKAERRQHALNTEASFREMLAAGMITSEQADEMLATLYRNYSDVLIDNNRNRSAKT